MNTGARTDNPLAEFARAHGLEFAARTELPARGGLLSEDDLSQDGAATGDLAPGEPGTLCRLTYTYRSDDSTHTVKRTAAVLRIPESIGFAPYLGERERASITLETKSVDVDGAGSIRAAEDVNDHWLVELFSPAFAQWLGRNPDDFAWELADGVLCVSRQGHLSKESELATLCADAAHIAARIREECLEEVESGGAERSAAKPRKLKPGDRLVAAMLDRTTFANPPADVASTRAGFRERLVRHPSTYFIALLMTLMWMLVINVVGGGIFGLLLNLPNPGLAVLIFELVLFVVVGYFALRSQINGTSEKLAAEGFWREYARTRGLRFEDPAEFAATHAKAELPGRPVRVMTGTFDGVRGSLLVTGDGFTRGDSIALVAGPTGPTASLEFDVSAPGASAKALDRYAADLALDLRTRP